MLAHPRDPPGGLLFALFWGLCLAGKALGQPTPLDPHEFQVNTYTTDTQADATVAVDFSGGFVVAWSSRGSFESDSSASSVQARRFSNSGAPLSPTEFQVNTYTHSNQYEPAVGMDPAGNFVVAWLSHGSPSGDAEGYSVQARRFRADGEPIDAAEFQVNSDPAMHLYAYPAIAIAPTGDFVVVWTRETYVEPLASVRGRRFRADGTPRDPVEFEVSTPDEFHSARATVAADAHGNFVVAWFHWLPTLQMRDLRARRYSFEHGPLDSTGFRVDTSDETSFRRSAVAADPAGNFIVAWIAEEPIGNGSKTVRARRFAVDGTPLDPEEFEVSSATTTDLDRPAVAFDREGNFVVLWSGRRSPGGGDVDWSVHGRRFRADGTAVDAAEFQLNTLTTGYQTWPKIAVDVEGDFIAAWHSYRSLGTDQSVASVQARRWGRPRIAVTTTSPATGGPDCTLRDAITAANLGVTTGGCPPGNAGAVIELPERSTIALSEIDNGSNGLPRIERSVTIRGRRATVTRDPGLACPSVPEFRLFEVADGGILTLEDVQLRNGCVGSPPGGAVISNGGTLVLRRSAVEGSESAGSDGGGIAVVGGNLLLVDSSVRGNVAFGDGGGVSVTGITTSVALQRATVAGNRAASGGGVDVSGTFTAFAENSTISSNIASAVGGGLRISAGTGRLGASFSTVTGNEAPVGSGISLESGEVALHGTLVGDNEVGEDCFATSGILEATGANLDTDGSCAAIATSGVTTVPTLALGPLADNGGWTRTHLPGAQSPAVDTAPSCTSGFAAPLVRDGRAYPRPTDDDGDLVAECELGAIERGPAFLDGFESSDALRWTIRID